MVGGPSMPLPAALEQHTWSESSGLAIMPHTIACLDRVSRQVAGGGRRVEGMMKEQLAFAELDDVAGANEAIGVVVLRPEDGPAFLEVLKGEGGEAVTRRILLERGDWRVFTGRRPQERPVTNME